MKNFRIIPKSVINYRNQNTFTFDIPFYTLVFMVGFTALLLGAIKAINPYLSSFVTCGASILIVLYLTGKFSPFDGLSDYKTKRDGQIAVIYGAFVSGFGIFLFSPLPYLWLEPIGAYGLAMLFGGSLFSGGIYIILTTPILEPSSDTEEEPSPEVVCHVSERTNEWNKKALERAWGRKIPVPSSEVFPVDWKPEKMKKEKVPLVHQLSAYKTVKNLSARDIIRQVEVDSDWLAEDGEYICVQVERGSIACVNLANNKPFQLVTSQKVLVLTGQELLCGTIRLNDGIISFNVNGKIQEIQASQILGSIDWILPV